MTAYGNLNEIVIWALNETEIVLKGHIETFNDACFTYNNHRIVSVSKGKKKYDCLGFAAKGCIVVFRWTFERCELCLYIC